MGYWQEEEAHLFFRKQAQLPIALQSAKCTHWLDESFTAHYQNKALKLVWFRQKHETFISEHKYFFFLSMKHLSNKSLASTLTYFFNVASFWQTQIHQLKSKSKADDLVFIKIAMSNHPHPGKVSKKQDRAILPK